MKRLAGLMATLLGLAAAAGAQPIGTAFTYQGRLTDAGNPASGPYDLQLALFDAASGGAQVGPLLTRDDVTVSNGLFTVSLDFGASFAGAKRWLEIGVRPGASTGAYTTLAGRQELTPGPNAVFSSTAPWAGIAGKPAGFADDTDDDTLGGLPCANGQIAKRTAGVWACAADTDTTYSAGSGLALAGTIFSLSDLGVTTPKLADGAVTSAKIADNTIASADILNQSIASADMGAGSVVGGAGGTVADNTISSEDILNQSIASADLGAGSVVGGLAGTILDNTVTGDDIANGTIALADLGQNGCGSGQVLKWNGSAWACSADADGGGDITAVAAGAGLTGGGTSGAVSLGVNLAGSGSATSVARSDHDHLGQAWSGSFPASAAFRVENAGSGGFSDGVWGVGDAAGQARGVVGYAPAPSGQNFGVWGQSDSTDGRGVWGVATTTSGSTYGTYGESDSTVGRGVYGHAAATTGVNYGVYGDSVSTTAGSAGVFGRALGTGPVSGIEGRANTSVGNAIYGQNESTAGGIGIAARGVTAIYGEAVTFSGTGVFGYAPQVGGNTVGVRAQTESQTGKGLWALATNGNNVNYALYAENPNGTSGYAGYFTGLPGFGHVHITGTLSKGSGSFMIDHPLDPENKYLYHSFVESPDMMNIYNGNVTTDADGYATIRLPAWFEALNRDFRYQLTVLDEADTAGFVQAKVVRKVADNRFTIRTSAPRAEVSWQVTGIRHDALAEMHRIPVEEDKPEADRGKYLYPVEHGQPAEKGVDWERSWAAEQRRQQNP